MTYYHRKNKGQESTPEPTLKEINDLVARVQAEATLPSSPGVEVEGSRPIQHMSASDRRHNGKPMAQKDYHF